MQLLPDPPPNEGAIAQLGERLLCKQEVIGSIPIGSTSPSGGSAARVMSNAFQANAMLIARAHRRPRSLTIKRKCR